MSTITYTAKREIEKLAYLKTGTDISAAAADDSFNATSTDLSGLLDDEWINVSGFVAAADNGWFQANGASTANKIAQDTSTALVDEAAGPTITIQGHKRGLGQQYTLEFGAFLIDRSVKDDKVVHRAIGGGLPESIFRHSDVIWSFRTEVLAEALTVQWREFLASVKNTEPFTFDPFGTIAVPDAPVTVYLDGKGYAEQRFSVLRKQSFDLRVIQA